MASLKAMSMGMVLIMAAAMMMAGAAEAQQDCASKLLPCVDYLNGTKPSSECCDSIKEAVKNELPCLCTIYTTPNLLKSFGVTVVQALNLTASCGVPVRLQECNATAPSPLSEAPPGVPGKDGNGSERTTMAGIFTVFLLFVSMLFN